MKGVASSIEIWNKVIALNSQEVVLEQLFQQLKKDFERVGIQLNFTIANDPKKWIADISTCLKSIDDQQMNQLLYLIDLPEIWSKNMQSSNDPFDNLAEGILYRELVKVYYRQIYST